MANGNATFLAPASGANDAYQMALAISGLGSRSIAVIDGIGEADVRNRFASAVTTKGLESGSVPALYIGHEVVRAQAIADGTLLGEPQRQALEQLVSETVSDSSKHWNAFEILNVVEISHALGKQTKDVTDWSGIVSQRLALSCTDGGLNDVAAAITVNSSLRPCPGPTIEALWEAAAQRVAKQVSEANASLVECENLVAMARLQVALWPADGNRHDRLVSLMHEFESALADGRSVDLLPCAGGGLRTTAELIRIDLNLPPWVIDYLSAVLRAGSEPMVVSLEASGLAGAMLTARRLGTTLEVRPEGLRGATDEGRLDLLLVERLPATGWSQEIRDLAAGVAKAWTSGDGLRTAVLMRAVAQGGSEACTSPAMGVARQLVANIASTHNLSGNSMATLARAARAMQRCHEPTSDVDRLLIDRSKDLLAGHAAESGNLLAASDAVEVLCTLSTVDLPSIDARWKTYGVKAAAGGGVADESHWISLGLTGALAVIATADANGCRSTGMVGS